MMKKEYRWGIIGAGKIAKKFADGLAKLPRARLTGIASRTPGKRQAFAKQFDVPLIFDDYTTLVAHPQIEVIYVATTHNFHLEHARLALEHGKPVLLEKPFAVNAREAEQLIALARDKGLFLMEAMWTRYLPIIQTVREWLSQGLIGEVRLLQADFGFVAMGGPTHRTFNPDLAGGALLDIGIYPISLAYMLFQEDPKEILTCADLGPTGVDDTSAYLFKYANGAIAQLTATLRLDTRKTARITGTRGHIDIPLFWRATEAHLFQGENKVAYTEGDTGLHFQAKEVMECLDKGLKESPLMPLDETLRIMRCMDGLRKKWGLSYPME